jgi:hypothetical protein
MALTKDQLRAFVDEQINSRNFLLFAKLLNITNQTNFVRVVELLYNNQINYFMLNDLRIIDDQSVSNFLAQYDLTANPTVLFAAGDGVFSAQTWLSGRYDGKEFDYINNVISAYNSGANDNYLNDRKYVQIRRPAVLVADKDWRSYNSEVELRNAFQEKVVLPLLAKYGIEDIRQLFPLSAVYPVASAYPTSIRGKYESIFGSILPYLSNADLIKVFLTVNDDNSMLDRFLVEMTEISNFQTVSESTISTHRYHLFELSSIQRPYSDSEVATQETNLHEFRFPVAKLSENYSQMMYRAELIRLSKAYGGDTDYFSAYIEDLKGLAAMVMKFNEFAKDVYANILNSIKLINSTGN